VAISNRFQPPQDGQDVTESLGQISNVVDQLAVLAQYKPTTDAVVSAVAGDFKRLAPRATGQNVVIPTANGSNFGKTITLFVEATLGTCRVRPVTGTINGSTAFTLAAGYISLIVLVSNGQGLWATQRASGFPIAGNALAYTGETLNYVGSGSNVNFAATTGALGVVDISALNCGGALSFQGVNEASIDGFTAKPDGFWFALYVRDATTTAYVTLTENTGNTTTSIRTPGIRDWRLSKNDACYLFYSNSRWHVINSIAKLWIVSSDSVTWAAQQDNVTRTGRGIGNLRVTLTGNQILTGVVPENNGELLLIENMDTVDTLTINHDVTSTAANRFLCPAAANYVQGPLTSSLWRYDGTSTRWRMVSHS
jgi:hypothetical protein